MRLKTRAISWLDEQIGMRICAALAVRYGYVDENTTGGYSIPPGTSAIQRQEAAWRIAQANSMVRVADLATLFPALSPESLRKDLKALEKQGYLEAHGEYKGRWYGPVTRDGTGRRDVIGERGVEAVSGG